MSENDFLKNWASIILAVVSWIIFPIILGVSSIIVALGVISYNRKKDVVSKKLFTRNITGLIIAVTGMVISSLIVFFMGYA